MKKILMLLQSPFPPDIRLEKEIKSLSEAGYKVLVVCNQYDKKTIPDFAYCDIQRINALFNSVSLNRILNFPIFFNPRLIFIVFKAAFTFKPSFIHAHDLPMMPIGILVGKLIKVPIVFDMHENYPEALKYFEKKGIINFLFKNYRFAKVLEKICLKFSDRIIVVVEENKIRIISLGVNPQKVFIVSNTVNLDIFKNNDSDVKNIIFDNEKRPIILYSGIVGPDRGLLTAVKSAFHFEKSNICPLIIIIGEGSYKRYLTEFVEKNDLRKKVKFLNWPGHDKIPAFINKAAICMIPQPRNDFINTTVPHKLFEFMAIGKSLLVSDALPLKRIVEETNSGLVFKSDDSKDFSDKVFELLSSDIPYGSNGLKAVKEKYNWQRDSQVLIDMYRDLNNKLN